ncbi:adenosylcobinamide-phosphate synthase CbiB [Lichenibacterium ramalinae]|uniref:Cobalamin biosynthesis protein CobD n=1 Tax=Lichenibacterium ramalinae TaxID=2316527 RepID=A0A4Q2RIF5_9HYPH|nr:adenosylcobinamide-phosphate synthase CbiB [Lichenibacterium ramalinae]RYB07050.1 cobalamin biosynthesis protein CobD [Lichenibacterium ramalinae]
MSLSTTLPLTCLALAIEAAAGYPAWLYRAVGHPVTWMGAWLGALERRLNRPAWSPGRRRAAGVLALALLLGATALVASPLAMLLSRSVVGFAVLALLAASLPAQRSLHDHVGAVAAALERDGIEAGRRAVGMIVGRNTAVLDEAGVARAAIESLAENFSDGIVAPAFWMALGGLPGAALYKAANTADSMVGHRTPRHAAFGWAAARFDDAVNLPASRLSALWLLLAAPLVGGSAAGGLRALRRDARRHRSPNAGWPEAAMAGALGLKLAGPRVYGTERVEDAFMGDGRRDAGAADIRRALALYRVACAVQWLAVAAIALLIRL